MTDHPTALSRRAVIGAALLTIAAHGLGPARSEAAGLQQRILVFGDSQAQGLAGGVQRLYRANHSRRVLDHSKVSTGLIPRGNYDWPAEAKTLAVADHYDVALVLIGANDRPLVRSGGHVDPTLLARFTDSYGARVADIADDFRQANVPLVWVGHPIVRDAVWEEDIAILNKIFEDRATGAGATFQSTWDMFKGPDGGFASYGKGTDGLTTRLRADDGVHLTPAGYDLVTAALVPTLDRYRPGASTGPTASVL